MDSQDSDSGSRPVPDPTVLTTSLVEKAMEQEEKRVEGLLDVLRARLDGMDQATTLRLSVVDGIHGTIDEKVSSAGAVVDQKFVNVDEQFTALKERMAEQKTDTQNAVTAAFAASDRAVSLQTEASEKSIAKSEAATTKQIDALGSQTAAALEAIKDQITDLKLSVERITAAKIGGIDQRSEIRDRGTDNRANIAIFVTVGLFLITLIGIIITISQINSGN